MTFLPPSKRQSFDSAGVQFVWDSTSIKAAERCPRYYQLSILEAWTSPFAKVDLWFGGIYAHALETYHKLRASGVEFEAALREVVHLSLTASWNHDRDESGNRIPGTGAPASFDHETKSRETLIRTIIWYLDQFRNDPLRTYITQQGDAAVELSFKFPVDGDILFSGHLDRVVVDESGERFVHDQKTTRQTIGPYFFKSYKPDTQFALYTFAGQAIFNTPIKGVILDGAQIAVGFSRFARAPILFTEGELDEWYTDTIETISLTREHTAAGYFPMRRTSCGLYGGCPFRDVCSRPPSVRENFLKADFIQGPGWDPAVPR